MKEPFGQHKFFFAYEFPWAVNVPEGGNMVIVSSMTSNDDITEFEDVSYPHLRAALIQRTIAEGNTEAFK